MELVKKEIQRIMTTGSTTGCTDCFVFIPDLSVDYNFKIMLSARDIDFGFFDVLIPYGYPYGYGFDGGEPIGINNLL
jgi:hypothetical protein